VFFGIISGYSSCQFLCLLLYTGATKSIYAPEPFDVGRFLQVDIVFGDERATLTTTGSIDPGLVLYSLVITCKKLSFSNLMLGTVVFI